MRASGIILAAGRGVRFGGGKAFANLQGRPLLHWCAGAFVASGAVGDVVGDGVAGACVGVGVGVRGAVAAAGGISVAPAGGAGVSIGSWAAMVAATSVKTASGGAISVGSACVGRLHANSASPSARKNRGRRKRSMVIFRSCSGVAHYNCTLISCQELIDGKGWFNPKD
ncbi:MAG TPA: hypothetical protein EYP88_00345 [Anaerolineales bacterium]|nr:hypothetical protein [Anaerolineales bacterium]